jgi:hypothetical protein
MEFEKTSEAIFARVKIPKHPNNFKSISIHCLRPNETLL